MTTIRTTLTALSLLALPALYAPSASADEPASDRPIITINPAPGSRDLRDPATLDPDPGANLGRMVDGYRASRHAIGMMLRSMDDPMLAEALSKETLSDKTRMEAVGAVVAAKREVAKQVLDGELEKAFGDMLPRYDQIAEIAPRNYSQSYRQVLVEWQGLAREYTRAYMQIFENVDALYAVFRAGAGRYQVDGDAVEGDPEIKAAYAKYTRAAKVAQANLKTVMWSIDHLRAPEPPSMPPPVGTRPLDNPTLAPFSR